MEHIYGVPALADTDQIGTIGQWSRALARTLAARDAAIVRATGTIPEGDPETVAGILTRLGVVEEQTADTGWTAIPIATGTTAQPTQDPQCRRIGSVVHLRGGWTPDGIAAGSSTVVGTLPAEFRPDSRTVYVLGASSGGDTAPLLVIDTDGTITIRIGTSGGNYYLMSGCNFTLDTLGPPVSGEPIPPAPHTHPIPDVDGLQTALDGKLATTAHTWTTLTGKPATFPPTTHTHELADVAGLAARLAALEQDTGDRNITSIVPEATEGHWTVRRIGKWVYMNLYDLGLTATAGDYWQKSGFLPTGFRPPAASQYVHFTCAQRTTGFTPGPFRVDRYGGVTVYGVTGKLTAVTASWPTNDPFPTTLPGTPA